MPKLLLTSAGLTNQSIVTALETLMGKSAKGVPLAFIPTAANVQPGEKDWLIEDLVNTQKAGFLVDIVDISALTQEQWQPRLESAEVLLFGGGNTRHLMHWITKSGLASQLPALLETRTYVGTSAGSCIAGPTVHNPVQELLGEEYELDITAGLNLVNFHFMPHFNSQYFPKITKGNIATASGYLQEKVYAVDDQSALVVDGDSVKVVSEGMVQIFN